MKTGKDHVLILIWWLGLPVLITLVFALFSYS